MGSIQITQELTGKPTVSVECGGASTTSAGAWHLGTLNGRSEGSAVSQWLSEYLNREDKAKAKKKAARYLLVRAAGARSLARYAGPSQVPYSEDIEEQRAGKGSPFRMHRVPVKPHDGFRFQVV